MGGLALLQIALLHLLMVEVARMGLQHLGLFVLVCSLEFCVLLGLGRLQRLEWGWRRKGL